MGIRPPRKKRRVDRRLGLTGVGIWTGGFIRRLKEGRKRGQDYGITVRIVTGSLSLWGFVLKKTGHTGQGNCDWNRSRETRDLRQGKTDVGLEILRSGVLRRGSEG